MSSGLPPSVRVRVPATSANLGPGFDALGLALSLYDEVQVSVDPAAAAFSVAIEVSGEGADDVPRDASHLVVQAMHRGFEVLGVTAPALRLRAVNSIPHGRGLGSSAAAIVSGLLAARALVPDGAERLDADDLLAVAAQIEGHPDNVAACLLGGLTVAWVDSGRARGVRVEPARGLVPYALVPPTAVSTKTARGLLPAQVSHEDAALNAGRAALLVAALTTRPDLLLPATADRLHQDYREPAMPQTLALVRALRAADVPAVVSGAGPTVLAFADAASEEAVLELVPEHWRALALPVADGATVAAAEAADHP